MKKIIVGFVSLMVILLPCEIAFAFGRGGSYSGSRGNFSSSNRYGGSTSHSYGSSSHSNAYGGSTSHTAGQGTTHDSAYGTSTSHNYGGGTTHTNAYAGKTSGEYGEGATHTNTYGGSTSAKYGEGATHTNTYGGTTSAAYGQGAYHTGAYGYGTAYHPPTAYYGYHPPATVNYYGSTCANCNGWATAAAVTTAALLVRLSLRPTRTRLRPMPRPRQPTLTTPDTTPAQLQPRRINLPRPRQPWLRLQATIRWDKWLRRFRPVALHPPSKARPTTCVAIPGSAR